MSINLIWEKKFNFTLSSPRGFKMEIQNQSNDSYHPQNEYIVKKRKKMFSNSANLSENHLNIIK